MSRVVLCLSLALASVGCDVDLNINERTFSCTSDNQCKAGWRCDLTLELCVSGDASTLPDVEQDTRDTSSAVDTHTNVDTQPNNRVPVFEEITPALYVTEGQTLDYQPTVTDPDGDELIFRSESNGPLPSVEPATGRLVWTPSGQDAGVYQLTLYVSDGEFEPSRRIEITVRESVVTEGLLGLWNLDDATAVLPDVSDNGLPGTLPAGAEERTGAIDGSLFLNEGPIVVDTGEGLDLSGGLTAMGWIRLEGDSAQRSIAGTRRDLISMWQPQPVPLSNTASFRTVPLSTTIHADAKGFSSATFDGQYLYLTQYYSPTREFLRFNTYLDPGSPDAWEVVSLEAIAVPGGSLLKGYFAGTFDGRHVYFAPWNHSGFHTRALRFDTTLDFDNPAAWESADLVARGFTGSEGSPFQVFDGRYVYYSPRGSGEIVRFDTTHSGGFADDTAWETFNAIIALAANEMAWLIVAKGYIYGHKGGVIYRYNTSTSASFSSGVGWETHSPPGSSYDGAVFDGRYLDIFSDASQSIVRYDTQTPFKSEGSWTEHAIMSELSLPTTHFDATYLAGTDWYLLPYSVGGSGGGDEGVILRKDTTSPFDSVGSWDQVHTSALGGTLDVGGFSGAAYDGRYIYGIPWDWGDGCCEGHDVLLVYDTLANGMGFRLSLSDSPSESYGGPVGPAVSIVTEENAQRQVFTLYANRTLQANTWYHLALRYDPAGESLQLLIDGEVVASRAASGELQATDVNLLIGGLAGRMTGSGGAMDDIRIYGRPLTNDEMQDTICVAVNESALDKPVFATLCPQ